MQWARATPSGWNIGAAPKPIKFVLKVAPAPEIKHYRPPYVADPPRPEHAPPFKELKTPHYRPRNHSAAPRPQDAPLIEHAPLRYVPEPAREPEPPRIAAPAPSGIKEFKDEGRELQQAHATYKPKRQRGAGGTLEFETNMAAFEHENPRHRQATANVGYSAVKSMFRR